MYFSTNLQSLLLSTKSANNNGLNIASRNKFIFVSCLMLRLFEIYLNNIPTVISKKYVDVGV